MYLYILDIKSKLQVLERNDSYLSQPGIEPGSLDLKANTLPRRFYDKAVEVDYIHDIDPVTFTFGQGGEGC